MAPLIDTFHRANSATLGTADSGQVYTQGYGALGITSNKAHVPTFQFSNAWADILATDFDYTVAFSGSSGGMALRVKDKDNFYALYMLGGTTVALDRYLAGAGTSVASAAYVFTVGTAGGGPFYVLRARAVGTTLDVWVSGSHLFTATIGSFTTFTNIGLFTNGPSPANEYWASFRPFVAGGWHVGGIRVA